MILDTSAVVAIVLGEPGQENILRAIVAATERRISAVSVYEAGVVLLRKRGRLALEDMRRLLAEWHVTIVGFHEAEAWQAIESYARFGKGFNRIALNLGDCPVHALAEKRNEPVLSTSDEFVRAGVQSVT